MRNLIQTIAFSMIFLGLLLGCSRMSEDLTSTDEARDTQQTVFLTLTPLPTYTPNATYTPYPTPTPSIDYSYMLDTPFWINYESVFPITPSPDYHQSNREDFKEMDIDQGMGANSWMLPFEDDFNLAVTNQLDWIDYPEQIALRISGYPNPDYPVPEEIELYQPNKDIVIAIVTDWNMGSDSIFAYQYRVEMLKTSSYWIIDWFGIRWQCRRGHEDWGITPCV